MSDGDATPLGQRPLRVLQLLLELWASVRMKQLEPWFKSLVPSSVFSTGGADNLVGSVQQLVSSHVRRVWNGFLLGKVRGENVHCRFCGGCDGDGHFFWECPYPPRPSQESPESHYRVGLNKADLPRCLLWHGWFPALSGSTGYLWPAGAPDVAKNVLGTSNVGVGQAPLWGCHVADGALRLADALFFWSLMVVWFLMRFLELGLLGLVCMRMPLVWSTMGSPGLTPTIA